ncbi:MAG: acetate--CoA ligase family protein, partial [Nitrososphaeria archaeon]|nr:acetate--CoA ligase family protein [Nitrososphaeria archaeon]
MKLYEHEAVELFNRYNIPAPKSFLASTPEEARRAVERLGGQAVLKAQVLVGGRGKAGGIRAVRSPEEAEAVARRVIDEPDPYWPDRPPLVITKVQPHRLGWLFFYQSQRYL